MTHSTKGILVLAWVCFLALAGVTPAAFADGGDPTLIHACVNNSSGEIKIVGANASCKNNETALHWPAVAPPPPAASSSIMVHGVGAGVVATPFFVDFGGGVEQFRLPRDGTVQNMRVLITENSYNGPTVLTFFVNDVATSLTTTILAASVGNIDVPGSVGVLDGQKISLKADATTVSSGTVRFTVSYEIK